MKFGSKIQDKSVPEWRLNNIDYKALKEAVKQATTFRADKEHTESWQADQELQTLRKTLQEEFGRINAFVSLKVKEASTRLVSVESSIVKLQRRQAEGARRNSKRQLELVRLHLDHCNTELLRICRFLILQKIALRKLLKKFRKYYPYGLPKAQAFVQDLKRCPQLVDGEDGISFVNVDLDPYLLEISLVIDVLHELEESQKKTKVGLAEDTEMVAEELNDANSSASRPRPVSTRATFDAVFLGKASRLQSFLVSEESIAQAKFLLLQLGFHVVDDDMATASQKSIQNTHPTKLTNLSSTGRSPRSFQELHLALEPDQDTNPLGALSEVKSAQPVVITLFDTQPVPRFMEDEAVNQYPNLMMKNPEDTNCVVMCHVGGLRNHIIADNVSYSQYQASFNNTEPDDDGSARTKPLSPMDKLCIEWLKSHSVEECKPTISTRRTRFSKARTEGQDFQYYVCVDEDISIDGSSVPHALLEIRRIPPHGHKGPAKFNDDQFIVTLIGKFLDFNLVCCPLAKDLTLWKLLFKVNSTSIAESDLVQAIQPTLNPPSGDTLFAMGAEELLKTVAKQKPTRSGLNTKKALSTKKSTLSSPESQAQRIRYWNEFDDGDEAGQGGDSFYLDEEMQAEGHDNEGLIILNRSFVNAMYDFSESLRHLFTCAGNDAPTRPLLSDSLHGLSLGSVSSFGTLSTSQSANKDFERYMGYTEQQENSDYAYEYKHDHVVTLFYLTSLLISSITSGISLGIIVSIFRELSDDLVMGPGTGVATIIVTTLLVSLLLSCSSLLLLFSRYNMAPWWHYTTCFLIFFVVACTVCYGMIEIFL
ncbi:LADA_0F04258g1_1 [Lachancea dasiensis]|uniref:LADA_0F04258g1_1 n=1 Tax=Lachancea dasiensis TaxID=1072105 RepID=A0A1G4JJU3_9SACH|nr:LADA_0F04258g1_1 [Lachancea dasiensis]